MSLFWESKTNNRKVFAQRKKTHKKQTHTQTKKKQKYMQTYRKEFANHLKLQESTRNP